MQSFRETQPEDERGAAVARWRRGCVQKRWMSLPTGGAAWPGKALRTQIERDDIGSMILWGHRMREDDAARLIARTRIRIYSVQRGADGIKENQRT